MAKLMLPAVGPQTAEVVPTPFIAVMRKDLYSKGVRSLVTSELTFLNKLIRLGVICRRALTISKFMHISHER